MNPIGRIIPTVIENYLPGKEVPVRLTLIALLSGGHLLIEDIPGLGKTTLALTMAATLGLSFGRVQCTSDLLPADITGLTVYDREAGSFRLVKGPVFNNILLVDEINRAMPKTQSALLEAMEERRVTIDGTTYPLPEPFMVIATQNPAEQVGTFPLPESQMDRFLIRTGIGYPPPGIEKEIIRSGSNREEIRAIVPLVNREEILADITESKGVYLSEKLTDYIHALLEASRNHPLIQTGISTRGGICLADAARAMAFLDGRDYVIPEDIIGLAAPATAHRILLRGENEGLDKEGVLTSLLESIPVPLS
jgi:MoxR-like ATPase